MVVYTEAGHPNSLRQIHWTWTNTQSLASEYVYSVCQE